MFGHSLGGAAAAAAMAADRRILAGIDLDGSILVSVLPTPGDQASLVQVKQLASAVAKNVGDRPFMIMTHAGHGTHNDATLDGFWATLSGWRLFLTLTDSGRYSYTDDEEFLSQLVRTGIIPRGVARQVVIPAIGTIDPARAVARGACLYRRILRPAPDASWQQLAEPRIPAVSQYSVPRSLTWLQRNVA